MRKRNPLRSSAYMIAVLFLVLVIVFSGLQILESTVFTSQEPSQPPMDSKTITVDGVDYFPKQDITVWLIMGIDREGAMVSSNSYNNDGEADVVVVAVFDQTNQQLDLLCLNRDTMVQMPVLGLGGRPAGTYYAQLALAHTYGDGMQDSCENTVKTVSDLLGGVPIDYYIAMNMDAIALINDSVGGVTVDVKDDFSAVDASIPMGQVKLKGQQALHFIRARKDVGDHLNVSRMQRHQAYMQGFMEAYRQKYQDGTIHALSLYEDLSAYMLTDATVNTVSAMMDRYAQYTVGKVIAPEGENVQGKEFLEFYIDEDKLNKTVLELFYAPKH